MNAPVRRLCGSLTAAWLTLCPVSAEVMITEFLAQNDGGLTDDRGRSSDWIELTNTGEAAVNLAGWHLTDDAADLRKWKFPALSLGPNQRLLVWASGDDRRDPARPLHTNFSLRAAGEYLALVQPDGVTVAQDFGAAYPPQFTNVSYGLGESSPPPVTLIAAGSNAAPGPQARVRVPQPGQTPPDNADEATWMRTDFDDSAAGWTTVHTGIGYSAATPSSNPATPNSGNLFPPLVAPDGNVQSIHRGVNRGIYIRIPFEVGDVSRVKGIELKMQHDDGFVVYINGVFKAHALVSTGGALPTVPLAHDAAGVPALANADVQAATLKTIALVGGDSADILTPGTNLLAIHGFNSTTSGNDALFNPQLSLTLQPELNGSAVYFNTPTPGEANNVGTSALGPQVTGTTETLPPLRVQPAWDGTGSLPLVTSAATGFSGTQGQGGWTWGYHAGTGAYNYLTTFTPFPGGAGQGAWDGAAQWWNGSGWDHNTAGAAPWTYLDGTLAHPNDSTPGPKETTVARWTSTVAGPHTLTGSFSRASASGNGTTGRVYRNGAQLFSAVTKGDSAPFTLPVTLAVGDRIDFLVDTGPTDDDSVDGTQYVAEIRAGQPPPLQNVSFLVTSRVTPTARPIATVTLKWLQMFAAEQTSAMNDSGTDGDAVAGDGVWSATVTTNALQPGQLIRWRVEATDDQGRLTRDPPQLDPASDQKYFGTIADDPSTASSRLPVLHWFMASGVSPDTNTKAPVTIYYKGELYDNCQATVHGQSTQSFPKKSNDIDTPSDHRMKVFDDPAARRAKDFNLLSSYADKSKMRTTLAYETFAAAGAKGHYAFPVRVHRNGAFHAVADFVEDADDRFLERVGLDPAGALYKVYNSLDGSALTTTNSGGVEKKTRRHEGTADFQAMIDGLSESRSVALRRQYAYDNLNVPQYINMMAVTTLMLHNDWGHKNYYMYRDSDGTGEWFVLPWDLDLTFGHTWISGPAYFDDDIDSSIGVVLGPSNRLKSLTFGTSTTAAPEMVQMLLRRLRTLLDRFVGPAASPPAEFETRMRWWADQIDSPLAPPGQSDAMLDFKKWGFWIDGSGTQITWTDARGGDHLLRPYLNRLIDSNPNPPYPAANPNANLGRTTVPPFLVGRRAALYAGSTLGQSVPAAQVAAPTVNIAAVEVNPGAAGQEYVKLTNPNSTAVDVSGWTLSGAVDFRIPDGTVIPAGNGTTQNIGALFIAKDVAAFRARTTGPRGGQYCFCVGPYDGQLSARGETLVLSTAAGAQVATTSWPASPTPAQVSLRVSQILFEPLDPTPAELAVDPGLVASDFEWIELVNTGAVTLDLAGAQFTDGVAFTFPAATSLAPGQKLIVAANLVAFAARYPGVTAPVFGPWVGQLDNSGETLQMVDAGGESVLEFSYNDAWYPPADHDGHALVFTSGWDTSHDEWGQRVHWGVSLAPHGTPGADVPPTGMVYNFWANTAFTKAERDDPLVSAPEMDVEADTLPNLLEYALGTGPKALSTAQLPTVTRVSMEGQPFLALSYRRQKNCLDLDYIPEASNDVVEGWTPILAAPVSVTDNGDGTETVTVVDAPAALTGRRLVRLRVVLRP